MSEIIKNTGDSPAERSLYLAFELGNSEWKLGFSIGLGQAARQRKIQAGDLVGLEQEIRRAKERFKLIETARVVSCYEAGRDGFWLHRYLVSQGVDNRVVDAASIEVNRRAKRAKTDSLDASPATAGSTVSRRCWAIPGRMASAGRCQWMATSPGTG